MNRGKISGMLLVAAVFSIPAPSYASHGELMNDIYFFTDATYTVQVGHDSPDCTSYGVVYTLSGQRTQYSYSQPFAYCANDGYYPYMEPWM